MNVKIDTREKFHVITITEPQIAANMTEELTALFNKCIQNPVKNIILNLQEVTVLEIPAAEAILAAQQNAYENNQSFVVCQVQPAVEEALDKAELLELMNTTPTESEAWDIVQMEEIERELLDDEQ
ncbi:MAG: STAS domain-containing protein [Chitinophagaceae bacterium]|nr:STAS domain-containing protein [Chitinophagaceae bacterium]